MIYNYSISGLHIRCSLPYQLMISGESMDFIADLQNHEPDFRVSVELVDQISFCYDNPEGYDVWTCADDHGWHAYHRVPLSDCYYGHVFWNERNPDLVKIEILEQQKHYLENTQNLLNLLTLEAVLLQAKTLLLHSAFIRAGEKGILFSAPSGTGKSTQASLWQQHRQADIINGDRAALRSVNGVWTAWGLPYAGTSGIYRNISAPIEAVVALRQAKTNAIRRLRPAEAIRYLYPELTLHRWEAISVEKAMNLLTELVCSVPVYLLECRPDEEAVCLLEQTLKEVF